MRCMQHIAACLVLALMPALAWAEGEMALFWQLTSSVLKVEAHNGDGSVSLGSGVVVGDGIVATNCHVTRNAYAIELVKGALRRSVEAQHSELEHDLCLLYAPQAGADPIVAVDETKPRVGQAVYAVGFILGIAPRLSAGHINAVHGYDEGKVIETDAAFTSGASGGGLFQADGKLVGIVTFKSRQRDSAFYCLPAAWVAAAMKHLAPQPVKPLSGATFWQRPEPEQPYFLRAATLEAAHDWQGLAALARQWSAAESASASPWYALGKAQSRRDHWDEAIAAYRSAVAAEADFAPAWYRLGRAYQHSGDGAGLRGVRDVLQRLDPVLEHALSQPPDYCPQQRPDAC